MSAFRARPGLREMFGRATAYTAGSALVIVILVGCGWAVTGSHSKYLFALVATVGLIVLAMAQRGAFVGLLLLAVLNGVPFVDTSASVAHHISAQDLASLVMIATAAVWTISGSARRRPPPPIGRIVSACGLALFIWCAFTVARTSVSGHASVLGALRMGRDFLYFSGVLMFLPRVSLREREIRALVGVLVVGVCLFSVGQIITVEGLGNVGFLVHAAATAQTLGFTRIYAPMNDLLFAGVAAGIATVALARRANTQAIAIPVTLLLTTSLVVQLTRARWIALILSVVVVSLWLALQADRGIAVRLRRRLVLLTGTVAAGFAALLAVAPGVISAGPLVHRFLSIFTDVGSSNTATSTVAVRQQIANAMTSILGEHWPLGVGLIPPSAHYYLNLPAGSLRNPDVGVLNAVMTIGVIGAALIYLPLIVVLLHCMRRVRHGNGVPEPWLTYGGQIFIVAAIAASITLITLFSVGGLMLTGVTVALLCQVRVSGSAELDRATQPAAPGAAPRAAVTVA